MLILKLAFKRVNNDRSYLSIAALRNIETS